MIVALYAGLLGLMMIGLSLHVIRGRVKFQQALGANHFEMNRRVRAQGNFAEYAPLFIALVALAEYQGLPHWAVHVLGIWFVAARAMHAYSLLIHERYEQERLTNRPVWRIRGMRSTFAVIGIISVSLLVQYLSN